MTAYTDAAKIASYLGVTLTSDQATQAGVVAQAASDWIDQYLGRSWQAASPVADEVHSLLVDRVYLDHRPVSAVSAVSTRQQVVGLAWSLLASSQYELRNAANGELLISGWASAGVDVKVSYTHTGTAPPSQIALAATMIASAWLSQTLRPSTQGLDQISVGQNDISVKFSASRADVPAEALRLLGARSVAIA